MCCGSSLDFCTVFLIIITHEVPGCLCVCYISGLIDVVLAVVKQSCRCLCPKMLCN